MAAMPPPKHRSRITRGRAPDGKRLPVFRRFVAESAPANGDLLPLDRRVRADLAPKRMSRGGCASEPATSARAMRVEHPSSYWIEHGFVEMIPAILPATTPDGRERITVWLRLPEGAFWRARWRHPGAPSRTGLSTRYDRRAYRSLDRSGSWEAEDFRGTRFLPEGQEFHVLRPDTSHPGQLSGFE